MASKLEHYSTNDLFNLIIKPKNVLVVWFGSAQQQT